jgi:membrane-bound lytic murein transglycosylase F
VRTLITALAIAAMTVGCGRTPVAAAGRPVQPKTAAVPPGLPKPAEAAAPKPNRLAPVDRDLPEILASKKLPVLVTYNSTGYFMYRGETMGYEYELLRRFAAEHALHLEPVLVRDSRRLFDSIDRGEGDLIAAQLVAGTDRSQIATSDELYETSPVVVQRNGPATAGMTPTVKRSVQREEKATPGEPIAIKARLIDTPSELGGQKVHLSRSSPYRSRLLELNEELSHDIDIVEVDESADRLIQRTAEGEIAYTVTAENVAALRTGEYANLVIRPALGQPEPVVWGLRTNAPLLRAELNRWLAAQRRSGLLRTLYQKYFLSRRAFRQRVESRYLTSETGQLSPYDDSFRQFAKIPGWDWRMVASMAYQESRFNPAARSWVGASGLMQLMPRTAREMKVDPRDPVRSIEGACRYLWRLDDQLKDGIADSDERVKFVLAAYNVGLGHIEDARRLAKKHGDHENRWIDVAYWLIRKSKRDVYNDPVVKYGFARGTEPVAYVDEILDRYENYKMFVVAEPEEPPATNTASPDSPIRMR